MYCSLRESPNSRYGILRRKFQWVVQASGLLLLAACGGGGGGGSDPPSSPANPPSNAAPVANAGADQTIELPSKATLQGSATDSDTAAGSLTYAWSGSGVTFSAPTAATTDATFASSGVLTLTLTVSDGASTGTDTVIVTVNPAMFPEADTTEGPNDPHGWTRAAAADVGMAQAGLDAAATVAQTVPVQDPPVAPGSGMIVRHGRLVHSWGDIDTRLEVKSVTKSMGGIALGLAVDEGKISLADKAIDKMPTFGVPPDINATKGRELITISQLATHTAGFPKLGGFEELTFQPGTTWAYSDGGLNWLADVLTEVYNQDLSPLMATRVWSVLGVGADDITWRTNFFRPEPRASNPSLKYRELASGISTNVNAMARVGLLFLRRGMWKDQRILSEQFIDIVQTPRPENAGLVQPPDEAADYPNATRDYGVLWWTNKSGLMANVPQDAYWAWGLGEALIVVIPSLDLVIARNGGQATAGDQTVRVWNDNDWNGDVKVLEPFLDPIVAATTP